MCGLALVQALTHNWCVKSAAAWRTVGITAQRRDAGGEMKLCINQ